MAMYLVLSVIYTHVVLYGSLVQDFHSTVELLRNATVCCIVAKH